MITFNVSFNCAVSVHCCVIMTFNVSSNCDMSFQLNQATQLERQRWTRHCSAPSRPQCLRSTAGSTGSESLFAFTGVLAQPPRWKRMPPLSARLWDPMPLVTQRCTGSFVCFFNTWSRFSLTRPRVRKVRSWKFARPPKFFYPKSYWNAVHSRPSKFAKPFEARRKYGTSPSASLTLFTGACWCGSPARASGMSLRKYLSRRSCTLHCFACLTSQMPFFKHENIKFRFSASNWSGSSHCDVGRDVTIPKVRMRCFSIPRV